MADTDQTLYSRVEDAFFGILWTLQTTRKNDLVNLNILTCLGGMFLDFCHMLAFFVHGFGWGNITVTWGTYVRYVQLQLPLYHYEGFAIAFWFAVGITVFITVNALIVGQSFWTKAFNQLWAIKLLHFVVAIVFNFVFIASFYLLITPWWCDPELQVIIPFYENGQSISCFGWPNILSLVMGSISIVILVFLVYCSTLASPSYSPEPNDLDAICSPAYRLFYNSSLIFMTIDEYYIAKVIPVTGHWWEALFNLILVTTCIFILIYYLPYQIQLGNELRGGMLGLLWWCAACSFVCINMAPNKAQVNRVIDYVLLAGLIPFAIFGYLIVRVRYTVVRSFAMALVEQIPKDFTPEEQNRARFGTRKQDYIQGSERNPDIYFPNAIQHFSTNLVTVEILGRLLWFETDDKRYHEAAFRFYRLAEMAYPDVAYVKLLRATCLTALADDPQAVKSQIDMVKTLNPTFSVRFALYKREMEAKQKGSSNTSKKDANQESGDSAADDSLDLVAYVEFQKYYLEAQRYNAAAVDAIREFWSLFLQPEVTFVAFNNAARNIEAQTAKALVTYKTLLIRYPKHIAILTSYAYFLDLVMHNAEEAAKYHQRADEIRSREAESNTNKMNIDGRSSDAGVISINEDGTIDSVNKVLCTMFGYARLELIGRNIKSIVPSPWREKHDLFLDRYRTSGEAKVIGQPARSLFGLHKQGYAFAMNLTIQERRKDNGDKSFIAMIAQTDQDKKDGVVIIREDGTILLISKAIIDMFGYTPAEVLRTNVTIFMNDAYAANHESYLRRYKETGEARVIGTPGRNVPARRKDGSIFPASLTVEEEYVGYEKYFMANIQDTTHLKATIYMDGFGTIQNVDNGIALLLGYRKDDIVGRNIKNIMPPPYNQYHDMYLERYRRTKISNILRAAEGRVLPAVHADGSIVQIRAIIARVDNNEGANANMLFKGVIQRVDSVGRATVRQGFNDNDYIEITKDGYIKDITRSLLSQLGYNQEHSLDEFIGQSIEIIIPPLPSRPNLAKEYWIPKCLSAPDYNFYTICVNKNYALIPFTINCTMKSADTLIVRFKDISGIDAIISIDENGTVLAFNEDAFLLLGHDQDETIGRNIKHLLAKEIADQHDGFLERYKNTKVKRVVGVARTLNTIHRDQSVMPIEIQVTEVKNEDSKTFVGRIRHVDIEERADKDFMDNLRIAIEKTEVKESVEDFTSKKSSKRSSRRGSKSGSKVLADGSVVQDEEIEEESEESDSESDDEGESADQVDHQGIDAKLRYIKESEAQDKTSLALAFALKYSMIAYAIIFAVALIVFNVLPSAINFLSFMQQVTHFSTLSSDIIAAARQLQLQQNSATLSVGYPCSWDPKSVTPVPCGFASNNNVSKDLLEYDNELESLMAWFTTNYLSIRVKGDEIDRVYSSDHTYYSFSSANLSAPQAQVAANWAELANAKLRPALQTLARDNKIANTDSRLAWSFVIYNRDNIYDETYELIEATPEKIRSLLNVELIVHLVFTLILLVFGACLFLFLLGPRLNLIQANRMLILKLVLLVPRAVIWEFVYVLYRSTGEEDEEQDDEFESRSRVGGQTTLSAKMLKKGSDQETQIIPDKRRGTFLIFIVGLFSLAVPAIAHCIWRLTSNAAMSEQLNFYLHTTELYIELYSLKWREQDLWLAGCTDSTFCPSLQTAKTNLAKTTNHAKKLYSVMQEEFAGNEKFSTLLYRVTQFNPVIGADFCPSAKKDPATKNTRCNDSYKGADLPSDFSIRATRGSGSYAARIIGDSSILSQTANSSSLDDKVFWFTWESLPIEGSALLKELDVVQEDVVRELYSAARTASNATYGVSLAYMLILFLFGFATVRQNLQNESKHNRSILFMIPLEVVKRNKQILDYIDQVFLELSA